MLKNKLETINLLEEMKDEVAAAELGCDYRWEADIFWTEEVSPETFRAEREIALRGETLRTVEESLWEDEVDKTLQLIDDLIEEVEERQKFRAADNADYLAELGKIPKKYFRAERELALRHDMLSDLKDCLLGS